ncbi:DUF2092 domain-containing protein [Streptomyces sp. NPDC001904]|uniref:LolA family protein n=1 Tax=Streptomyces sp. NPDC001904 TaxID=3154531 RepID=UPI003316CAB6
MAPYETEDSQGSGQSAVRRKAVRYAVPVTVVGVAAAAIGLVPALADSGDPDLPKVTARELIEKIAASDTEQLSGTVKIHTDLGLPSLGGAASSFGGGAAGKGSSSADPKEKLTELASGTHTLRVAADGQDRQKLSVLDDASEYSVIHNGDDLWAYDSASDEAYHATADGKGDKNDKDDKAEKGRRGSGAPATPKELTDRILKASGDHTSITVDGTAQVAGRDAYRLQIKPKQSGSTVGAVTVAVDAKTGTPLKFTLTPASGGAAVVDAGFTSVDFGRPAASTFDFKPAKGTKVTEADDLPAQDRPGKGHEEFEGVQGLDGLTTIGEGWTSVAELKLPKEAAGLASGAGSADLPADASKFLSSLGDRVKGDFGSGTVYSTRLVNVLVTEDGTVYAGAVTKDALVKAADAG